MIDLRIGNRGYFYFCKYWKRDISQPMDNDKLILFNKPNGEFRAKIISEKDNNTQDVAGVFRIKQEGITIETREKVDIEKDDLVLFKGKKWIVTSVRISEIQKSAYYDNDPSKITTIGLQKE